MSIIVSQPPNYCTQIYRLDVRSSNKSVVVRKIKEILMSHIYTKIRKHQEMMKEENINKEKVLIT